MEDVKEKSKDAIANGLQSTITGLRSLNDNIITGSSTSLMCLALVVSVL